MGDYSKDLDTRESDFLRQLVYGVIENQIYLDYVIQKASKIKLKKLDKLVLNSLRLGTYELYFLSSKKYAVINEIVNLVKKNNFRSKNFVNGVLRTLDREEGNFSKINISDKIDFLSTKYSINQSLLKYIIEIYGLEIGEKFISNLMGKANFSIRVNTSKIKRKDLIKKLESKGFRIKESRICSSGLIIENPEKIIELEEFKEGLFTVQDQGSILVSEILNPRENSKVLDLCAAPGSKTSHLAQIANDKSEIYANDISEKKLYKIKDGLDRLGFSNYKISNYDACKFIEKWENLFDYILVDVPCSGLGVMKRKPFIKLRRNQTDIRNLSKIQFKILDNAFKYLKKGGSIVYSTCTIGPIENEDVINKFLSKNKNAKIVSRDEGDFIRISPIDGNTDGFFICKMIKI